MASAKRDIRTIIDSLSEDLIQIAQDIVRAHVEREVADWQAKNQKLQARNSVREEKALRNQKALERIERGAEKRREREEKKAAERALRMEQRALATERASEKRPARARRGLLADEAAKKEAAPAPLFVHKRRRDGEIQPLKRSEEEENAKAAASSEAKNASPIVPEQLQLGL